MLPCPLHTPLLTPWLHNARQVFHFEASKKTCRWTGNFEQVWTWTTSHPPPAHFQELGKMMVYTCTGINAGEELCVRYIDIRGAYSYRQYMLQERKGFSEANGSQWTPWKQSSDFEIVQLVAILEMVLPHMWTWSSHIFSVSCAFFGSFPRRSSASAAAARYVSLAWMSQATGGILTLTYAQLF